VADVVSRFLQSENKYGMLYPVKRYRIKKEAYGKRF
jgi:hypothetical protein